MALSPLLIWAAVTTTGMMSATRADGDPIREKLVAAKNEYETECLRLRTVLRESMNKAEDSARASGNKAAVDKVKTDRKTFEETGKAPATTAGTSYTQGLAAAHRKLEQAYRQASIDYVKAKKDAEADVIEQELRAFQATKPNGSSPKNATKDPYQVGTIWAGQLRWNGDPGNHNYLFVVTERTGKTFKGIARLDYGPSGDPKRKGIYDIEGEVDGMNLKYRGDSPGLNEVSAKWNLGTLDISASAENGGVLTGSLRQRK